MPKTGEAPPSDSVTEEADLWEPRLQSREGTSLEGVDASSFRSDVVGDEVA